MTRASVQSVGRRSVVVHVAVVMVLLAGLAVVTPTSAQAAFPGANGLIAFTEDLPHGSDDQTTIRVMRPDGSDVRTVLGGAWQPSWSPDGRQIAYSDFPGGMTQVFVMNADGSGVRQVTNVPHGAEHPGWSPDGSRLVFARYDADLLTSVWTVRASDGGDARQVVPAKGADGRPTFAWEPAWSSDGRIAYSAVAWTSAASWDDAIFTVQPDGTSVTRVTSGSGAFSPDWSPDGRQIVFQRSHGSDPSTLQVVGADGTGQRQLAAVAGGVHEPVWSPDGTQVAFWTAEPRGIHVVNGDGSGLRLVRAGASAPSWQPIPGPTSDPESVTRYAGTDRIETAIAVSRAGYSTSGSAAAVVLARADMFPDALAGTPLAVAQGGPLLLTPSGDLDDRTKAEIQRVLAPGGTVFLLGGQTALSRTVQDQVATPGVTVRRLAGADRYATAVAIAEALGERPGPVFLATGVNFPDALGAGAAAAHTGGVVLLTADTVLPRPTADHLKADPPAVLYAVGGQAAEAVPSATPLVGADRFATARILAQTIFDDPTAVGIASGLNFPDGLSGGVHTGVLGGPLLLVLPDVLPDQTARYLAETTSVASARVYGGAAAVGHGVTNDVGQLVTGR